MAPDQPVIEVGVGGSPITIYPACESVNTSDPDENNRPRGSCAIVDFRILENDGIEGKYLIQWEDSAQGSNYDMDLWGVLSYEVSGSNITVTTVAEAHTNFAMGMGYYINGTNKDGLHIHTGHSGVDDFYFYDDSVSGVTDCSGGCKTLDGPTSSTYTAQTSSAISILERPLFFAAKYGGFDDKDESGLPDQVGEWDVRNNFTSAAGPDGLPDNYYHISNPAQLDIALDNTLLEIIANKEVSGTSAAILANSSGGDGEIVQALYFPQRENLQQGKTVEWSGELQSFFIDSYGLFREDTNGNAVLDGYDSDYVFEYFVDLNKNLRIDRFTLLDPSKPPDDESNQLVQVDTIDGVDIHPLWSAREALGNLSNTSIRTQRTYSDQVNTSTSGRYIFTFIDKDLDGEVDNGEVKDFVSSMITADLGSAPETWRFFGTASTILAQVTIDYVRGYEHPALATRSREIDFDNDPDTTDIVLRLGDIIHSTPVIVAEPTGNYDNRYGDTSYDAFETKYQDRRRVTYVGANDGMLHAFNSGFLDTSASNTTYVTSLVNETAHPLGAELWAYVPFNLLPHLQWLPNQNYAHTYYVDGEPQVFDVKIFDGDSDTSATALHPNGWGTILVIGMRLGGGDYPLDLDDDTGTNDESPACKDLCTRSAYIVLDITDPEIPPTLLAEITDNNLNFTIGQPSLVKDRTLDGSTNEWALAFGSGPKNATDVTTNENAKFYVYDLIDKQFVAINRRDVIKDSGFVQNAFVGDTSSADLDQDYQDDVVYFGLNSTSSSGGIVTHTGDLYRYIIPNNDFEMLLEIGQPVFSKPLSYVDGNDRSWVYGLTPI